MKKKFIFLMLIFSILCIGGGKINSLNAQETITIGEGGTLNYGYNPMASNYNYSVSQQIYTKSELSNGLAGVISDITLYVSGVYDANRNIEIWLMNTDKTVFDNNSDWLDLPAENKVFDSNVSLTTGAFTFDISDFTYTGGNLLLCMFDKTGKCPNYSPNTFVHFDAEGVKNVLTVYSDASSSLNNFNPTNINVSGNFTGNSYSPYIKTKVSFTITPIAVEPSVTVTPESIALGTVKVGGEYWTEKPFAPQAVNVKAQGGAVISSVTTTNSFFTFSEQYPGGDNFDFTVGYNKNGDAGTQSGNIVVEYDETRKEVPMTATAYVPAVGDVIEKPKDITFTEGAYTDNVTGVYDDYILPGETTDGNLKDAVYTFTLAKESLITASVTGNNPIVAIYNSDFGEKDGPSSDNNYEGIQPEPSAPTTFGPYTFTTDGTELTNNFVNSGWVHYAYNQYAYNYDYIYTMTLSSYILTKTPFLITNDSKLTFIHMNGSGEASGEGYNVFISTDNVYGNADDIIVEECHVTAASEYNEVPLSGYAGKEYYIGLSYTNKTFMLGIDDLALTDGSAKSRSVAQTRSTNQIDGVPYPDGTYYLVAAAEGDFTLNLSISDLTAPAEFALTAPVINATEQNNPILAWEAAKYASSYNVYIGTSSDFSYVEPIVVTTNSYQTENLSNNTRYYWTVEAVNEQGTTSTTSGTWSFVTTLDVPQNISANPTQIYEGESTMISWSAPENINGSLDYNIYVNGDLKGNLEDINLKDISYEISDLGHNINGHEISVTAVYDGLGESGHAKCNVQVCGYGDLSITVKDGETPIKGATVVLNGTDEFGNAAEYTGSTNEAGVLVKNVKAGEYTVAVSIIGYEEKVVTVEVVSGTPNEATISMQGKPTAPENLLKDVAVAEFGGAAEVTWTGAGGDAQKYNIFRKNVETGVVNTVAENHNDTYSVNKSYIDAAYSELVDGKYKYGVTTMVDADEVILNEGFENGLPLDWAAPWSNSASWTVYKYKDFAYNGTYSAYAYSRYNGYTANITTAVIDLTQNTSAKLSFYYKNTKGTDYANNFFVKIKKETEANWEKQIVTGNTVASYTKYEMSLDEYVGNRIQLSFEVTAYAYAYTYLDDIVITGTKKTESAPVWSNTIKKGGIEFTNAGGDNRWDNENNWSNNTVPGAEDEVTIKAAATISSEVNVKYLAISSIGSLTLESTAVLTADELVNNNKSSFIINDGAQLFHNSNNVKASFTMGIVNPEGEWNENNKTGWQFIASPFTEAAVKDFVPDYGYNYDLYRYAGSADEEWDNQKDNYQDQSWLYFNQGEGYLASYETLKEATLSGTLNNATSFTKELSYNEGNVLANFHLLGNPFSFDMNITKATFTNMVNGVAIVTSNGGYDYSQTTIPVGDGFFVKTTADGAKLSYNHNAKSSRSGNANSLNITATSNAGNDNVVINFAGEQEGFPKMRNFNDAIATVYVQDKGANYGIYNCDENTTEVELCFNANQMGNYTISIEPNGKFQTVTLVDRFTGIETNMLLEDYSFTAMSNENNNRFILKLAVSDQQSAVSDNFVYQSGEELIVEAEGTVQIIDVMGRVVYNNDVTSDNNRINVSDFNNGAYVVRVINESEIKVEKVVIY